MLSKAASAIAGVLIAHFYSDGLFPSSHAAWSWHCTYYEGGDSTKRVDMAPNATGGPTCADGSNLTCSCAVSPCEGPVPAVLSSLTCAGAGDDAGTSGCFKMHHTYGTPVVAHGAVAGRGIEAQVTDACGAADVIKVYGNAAGLDMLKGWGVLTSDIIDNSTQPSTAAACQTLCASTTNCSFFTFNDQSASNPGYGYFFGMCVLHKELACNGTAYSTFHGAIAGPSACPGGAPAPPPEETPAAETPAEETPAEETPATTETPVSTPTETTAAAAVESEAASDSIQTSHSLVTLTLCGILMATQLA